MTIAHTQRQDATFTGDLADSLFEMANLFPRTTGLPMTVWVTPLGGARHDARINVSLTPRKIDITNTAVVAIRPHPRLVAGDLSGQDFDAVSRWCTANQAALLEFWDETIDSVELGTRLVRLDGNADRR